MKLSHAHGATQDGWVIVERSDRMWSTGEENGKPLQYSCLENPMNSMNSMKPTLTQEKNIHQVFYIQKTHKGEIKYSRIKVDRISCH